MASKNAFITGVSSGLGRALAEELISRGYTVFGLSRRRPSDLLERREFRFESCDLSRLDQIGSCVRVLLKEVQTLDLVILNAGIIGELRPLTETSLAEIQKQMDVNVWANKMLLDSLFTAQKMVNQVVAISSGASVKGSKGWAGYSLSKATLNMLMRLYASEQEGTHFTALAPGLVMTDMLGGLLSRKDTERFPSLQHLHEGRKFSPKEAAGLILEKLPELKKTESGAFQDIRELIGEESF